MSLLCFPSQRTGLIPRTFSSGASCPMENTKRIATLSHSLGTSEVDQLSNMDHAVHPLRFAEVDDSSRTQRELMDDLVRDVRRAHLKRTAGKQRMDDLRAETKRLQDDVAHSRVQQQRQHRHSSHSISQACRPPSRRRRIRHQARSPLSQRTRLLQQLLPIIQEEEYRSPTLQGHNKCCIPYLPHSPQKTFKPLKTARVDASECCPDERLLQSMRFT